MGSERNFAFVFAGVFLVVALWPLWYSEPIRLWALVVAIGVLGLGIIYPSVLRPFNVAWFRFGLWIGKFTTPIFMTLVFIVAVVPTGLVLRILGKDAMHRRIDRNADTYWVRRQQQPGSMKTQF
jgi:hypothetical protein